MLKVEDHKPFVVSLETGLKVAVTFSSTFTPLEPGDFVRSQYLTLCILRPLSNHYPKAPFVGHTILHPKDDFNDEIAKQTALKRACARLLIFMNKKEYSPKIMVASAPQTCTLQSLEKAAGRMMYCIWKQLQDYIREFSQERKEIAPENKPEEIIDVGF